MVLTVKKYTYIYEEHKRASNKASNSERASDEVFFAIKQD